MLCKPCTDITLKYAKAIESVAVRKPVMPSNANFSIFQGVLRLACVALMAHIFRHNPAIHALMPRKTCCAAHLQECIGDLSVQQSEIPYLTEWDIAHCVIHKRGKLLKMVSPLRFTLPWQYPPFSQAAIRSPASGGLCRSTSIIISASCAWSFRL